MISLDLTEVHSAAALHELLASALSFPVWYGRNWDAFDECISTPEQSAMPDRLLLIGFAALQARLPRDADLLLQCLAESSPSTMVTFRDPTN